MPGVDIAEVIERLFRAQLRQEDAIGLHPQSGFEELLRGDTSEPLVVLAVEEAHVIGMRVEHEFRRILDGDQPLLRRNLPDQRLGPGGLPGPRRARDQNVSPGPHREAHEGLIPLLDEESPKLDLDFVRTTLGDACLQEDPALRELTNRPDLLRRSSDVDGDTPLGRSRRDRNLHALTARKGSGKERRGLIDALPAEIRDQLGKAATPIEVGVDGRLATPAGASLQEYLRRPVDADLHDIRAREERTERPYDQLERGGVLTRAGRLRLGFLAGR